MLIRAKVAGRDCQCGNEPVGASAERSVSGGESGCASQGGHGASQGCHVPAPDGGEYSAPQATFEQCTVWRVSFM